MTDFSTRAFEMADWEQVADLFQSPNCQWGTLQMPFQSRDDIKERLESPPPNLHRIVAVRESDGLVVGMISLQEYKRRRSHVGGIGMFVHDDHQNQGVGSALMEAMIELADNWLNLKRVELTVYVDNAAAVHLYDKFGFAKEGTHRKFAFRGGEYVDSYAMARVL